MSRRWAIRWATRMAAGLLLWLVADTGQALLYLSAAAARFRHIMPTRAEAMGYCSPPADESWHLVSTFTFSRHPRNFASLRLRQPPKNVKSTGLYRVAGEPVTVTVTPVNGNHSSSMPRLQVGLDSRPDEAADSGESSAAAVLQEGTQPIRGWRSGLIYMASDELGTESFEVTIAGAIKAPWFRLGRHSLKQWQQVIRHAPAPWAELQGELAILTLPSSMIRDLEDPRPAIRFYDEMVKDVHALMGLSAAAEDERDRAPDLPSRFVIGHPFHDWRMAAVAGYPVWLNWIYHGNPFVWLAPGGLRTRSAVLYGLGHNYGPWQQMLEPPGAEGAFASLMEYGYQSREGYRVLALRDLSPDLGPDFQQAYLSYLSYPVMWLCHLVDSQWWGYDARIWVPGTRLSWSQKQAFMIQLVRQLSYSFIPRMYRRFRHTPEELLPDRNSPQQKTDFFFEVLCEVTGQDLTSLFQHWKVPVSAGAYARVAAMGYDLPGP